MASFGAFSLIGVLAFALMINVAKVEYPIIRNKNDSNAVLTTGFIFFFDHINPQITKPNNSKKYIIVPLLNGKPILFTKKISKYAAKLTISGITKYITTATKTMDNKPARINPLVVIFLYFLK